MSIFSYFKNPLRGGGVTIFEFLNDKGYNTNFLHYFIYWILNIFFTQSYKYFKL